MARRDHFTKAQRQAIIERAKGICQGCGVPWKGGAVEADHILPVGLGGESTLENGQALCLLCHGKKTKEDRKRIDAANRAKKRNTGVSRPAGTIKGRGFAKGDKKPSKTATPEKFSNLPRRGLYRSFD